ncbi:SDR family NAD(P)-dependent oxidoreductase [Flammeovirga yaeyamensis]|uniref:SDR family NAD(P)-dependent oxidoreductase n=1 Tax=Flammeovirga yaeyamensis TaxID=367791 RepID=A0AAX1N618_9BACT|nr:SDR family oxidoreductase [Flammeovirga yaeyamensis]MBB3698321.1 NADP-dependent 3-hydroxy acid dehydrogenase YdfG [Flammeovirga yaeyamensis]NMF34326.1 SDR family oxidoreductase [Flammeovirga yaeyamensis]QWG01308.1 SDR family NAD(P)-dependent oxidoreductase [Flammeovirga yaeyamensis]
MESTNKSLIVITGASSGIGAATAQLFSNQGFPLLLLGRRVEKMVALNLTNTLIKKVDVTDYDAFKNAVAEAEKQFGQTEAIVNNAGMMLLGDIAVQDPQEWKKMFDVNIMGVLNGMQIVLPQMRARKGGTIINISSIAGRKTFGNHAAYCGTKFGVHAITENAREEAALDNVRMVTIAPGAVETELLSHTTNQEIKDGYESWKEEMGSILKAEDIANAIWYAFNQPQGVNVREIVLAATKQQP